MIKNTLLCHILDKGTHIVICCVQVCTVMWCLVIRLACPSLSLTSVTNRISLLLFHVLPHASQATSLCKQGLPPGPVNGQWEKQIMCCVCCT